MSENIINFDLLHKSVDDRHEVKIDPLALLDDTTEYSEIPVVIPTTLYVKSLYFNP